MTEATPWIERSAGVLLHLSSLPSGRIDADAERFTDWLARAGVRVWQILPLGPVDGHGSPFSPPSGFAGNVHLAPPGAGDAPGYDDFRQANADWLDDWTLFHALTREFPDRGWWHWPQALRDRDAAALRAACARHTQVIEDECRAQFGFARAFQACKLAANARGIRIFGDTPLFLDHHSADVWAHRELFEVSDDGRAEAVLGVPPDAFSDTGQWWGFPGYRWSTMAAQDWRWWKRRFQVQAQRFDLLRLDHFRGFAAWWRIPADAPSALHGSWVEGPGRAALECLQPVLGDARLVAEDLGVITEDVTALRQSLGIPGMRVLQFAFDGGDANPHVPAAHGSDTVCYTGTHDNDTTLGWWRSLDATRRQRVCEHFGNDDPPMPESLVDLAWSSIAPLSIVPFQDLLGLGSEARMNRPGVALGNWSWRFDWDAVDPMLADRLADRLAAHRRR
jgi:4-alpha-glucanotransferase